MITRNALKNQKSQKTKNFHMKSILNEVKNKSLIEELELEENDRLYEDFNKALYRSKKKQKQESTQRERKQQFVTFQLSKKQSKQKQQTKRQDQLPNNISSLQTPIIIKQPINLLQRRSSRIEIQLQQIIKYSLLYPSRSNSQKQISESMNKLLNNKQQIIPKCGKSHFCKFKKGKNYNKKASIFNNKQQKNKDMCLQLIENYNTQCSVQDVNKRKNVKYLLKKSKQAISNVKHPFDYTFSSFIESELSQLGLKKGRKTVGTTNLYRDQYNMDIRNQSIQNIHRFLRGERREDQQFTDFMTAKQIEQFRTKYDLYRNIYKKTKESTNAQKINMSEISQLSLKNAVFLNQTLNQCNTRQRRRQIQTIMKKLHFYR